MPTNNENIIETATTTVNEIAKKADTTGIIFMGLGFVGGIGLTFGVIKGTKVVKKKISDKKAAKAKKEIALPVVPLATAE